MKRILIAIALLFGIAAGFEHRRTLPIEPNTQYHVRNFYVEFKRGMPGVLLSSYYGDTYLLIVPTNYINRIDAQFVGERDGK